MQGQGCPRLDRVEPVAMKAEPEAGGVFLVGPAWSLPSQRDNAHPGALARGMGEEELCFLDARPARSR